MICNTCTVPTGLSNSCISIDRVIVLKDTITFCPPTLLINDVDITGRCMFAYSQDRVNWSCWYNYKEYISNSKALGTDFYLRILFREAIVPSLYLNNILINPDCYTVSIFYTNPFLNDPCSIIAGSGFDLYTGWECAMMMQQQLSDQVICMIGIPIYYFRVVPDTDTKSFTFKEYTLHNIDSVKQIKMIFPDGSMPSSKPTISEWDMEFEVDWEVELSKTQFATAFGTDAFPKQRDFIWVPLQKRMYMVNTAYEEKNENFMWRAVTWKLSLVKWQEQSNIDQGEFEDVINDLIVNKYNDVFERGENREGELTGTLQVSPVPYTASTLYPVENSDYLRKQITLDTMKIESRQINHGNIVVAKNQYICYTDSLISYQKDWCGVDEGTISLIFDTPELKAFSNPELVDKTKTLLNIGNYKLNIRNTDILIGDQTLKIEPGKTYILYIRWRRDLNEMEATLVKQVHPDIPSYKLKPTMYRFDFNGELSEVQNVTATLDPGLNGGPSKVELRCWPLRVCNFKLYNRYIDNDSLDEILKYATKDEGCIINDQARPVLSDNGYSVR